MDENTEDTQPQEEPQFYDEATLKRYKNLRMFQGKTDEEIIDYLNKRERRAPTPQGEAAEASDDEAYQRKFQGKLRQLQKEFLVEMNDANDAESLRMLVRLTMQNEDVNDKIRKFSKSGDTRELKNLGDFQRTLMMSIGDLQDKLGISRKMRKEKQNDDLSSYLTGIKRKAKELWERETVPVTCPRCNIEMARIWVNFPKLNHKIAFEGPCWKCEEVVIFSRDR